MGARDALEGAEVGLTQPQCLPQGQPEAESPLVSNASLQPGLPLDPWAFWVILEQEEVLIHIVLPAATAWWAVPHPKLFLFVAVSSLPLSFPPFLLPFLPFFFPVYGLHLAVLWNYS